MSARPQICERVSVGGVWRLVSLLVALLCTAGAGAEQDDLLDLFSSVEDARQSAGGGLQVSVSGIANDAGTIVVIVFDDPRAFAAFDHIRAAGYANIAAKKGAVVASFPELTAGPYAVFLFHDENGDYELNTTAGYPLEGWAYSGVDDPRTVPAFEQAAVASGAVNVTLFYQRAAVKAIEPGPFYR